MTKTWSQRWGRFYLSGLERDDSKGTVCETWSLLPQAEYDIHGNLTNGGTAESGSLTAIAGLMQRMVKSTTLA